MSNMHDHSVLAGALTQEWHVDATVQLWKEELHNGRLVVHSPARVLVHYLPGYLPWCTPLWNIAAAAAQATCCLLYTAGHFERLRVLAPPLRTPPAMSHPIASQTGQPQLCKTSGRDLAATATPSHSAGPDRPVAAAAAIVDVLSDPPPVTTAPLHPHDHHVGAVSAVSLTPDRCTQLSSIFDKVQQWEAEEIARAARKQSVSASPLRSQPASLPLGQTTPRSIGTTLLDAPSVISLQSLKDSTALGLAEAAPFHAYTAPSTSEACVEIVCQLNS